jgi:ubiquinone/menaquinone biosynthesis C-methylase UbiE
MENNISSGASIFSGSVPRHYDQFLGPMFFEPYAIEVSNRIDISSIHIALEIACGTGRVTRHLRNIIPSKARLIASDISPDMLDIAKEKLNLLDIEWQIIDAQELPFRDNALDLVVCCFGYMFVPDKTRAFAEAYRVLKPGGMFLFTTWDKLQNNAASFVYRTIAKAYLEDPLPESYNLAFSMSDEMMIRDLVHDAGFTKMSIEEVNKISFCPTAKEAAEGLVQGGAVYNEIMNRNPAWIEEIKMKVEAGLAEKFGTGPVTAPMTAIVTQAWKRDTK